MSTNLWCNIPSRVANANHYHPLFFEGICIFVFHAVKAPARKCFMSWRDGRQWHKSLCLYENMCLLVEICKLPFCERTWKVRQGHCWTDVLAWTDQHCIKNVSLLLSILVHSHNVPLTGDREIWPLCDSLHFGLKHVKHTHARKVSIALLACQWRAETPDISIKFTWNLMYLCRWKWSA